MRRKFSPLFYVSAGILGNIIEHHDKALFSLIAPFVSSLFFAIEPINSLIYTYAILSLSMLTRPVGALFFGYLADRLSRSFVLSLTLLGMAFSTLAMGCIPIATSYAPFLLGFFRALQHFFAAGETNASAVFVLEHSTKNFKNVTASLFEMSTILGILLASCELSLLGSLGVMETAWRIPFWVGGSLAFVGWIYRRKLSDADEYTSTIAKPLMSFREIIAEYKPLLALIAASGFSSATYVFSITFINSFLVIATSFTHAQLANLNTFLLLFDGLLLLFFSLITLKVEGEKIMELSAKAAAILAIPLFLLFYLPECKDSLGAILAIRMVIVFLGVAFASFFRAWAQRLFSPKKRCTLLGLGNSIAHLLIEGPLTVLSLAAFKATGSLVVPGVCLALTGLSAIMALNYSKKRALTPLQT